MVADDPQRVALLRQQMAGVEEDPHLWHNLDEQIDIVVRFDQLPDVDVVRQLDAIAGRLGEQGSEESGHQGEPLLVAETRRPEILYRPFPHLGSLVPQRGVETYRLPGVAAVSVDDLQAPPPRARPLSRPDPPRW